MRRAKELYEQAIREGNYVFSMFNLAVLLGKGGEEIETDAVRAKQLYEQAIQEGNHVFSMVNLAILLENGGVGV